MSAENALVNSFRMAERKHSGVAEGDGCDADQAKVRIRARLQELGGAADVAEFQCHMKHDWDSFVFHALAKRYGIRPYRYRKQRKSTILVHMSKQFLDELLWPIFNDVCAALFARFTEVTTALLPTIAPGPFSMPILDHDHDHGSGQLCENCRTRLLEQV